ncbi:hypothetical protein [Microcella sp.]|uniref:hypothetical protein n=1 Tax=Microcella sp. TaxID=1913979 RepID=UPI002561B522|nr:hypothetical protein [Microcella sp.]MBX9472332.1 hypothetical protein [Microcella sp.]
MDPITLVLLVGLGFAVLLVAGIGSQRRTGPWLPRLVAGGAIVLALLNVVGGIVGIVAAFAFPTLSLRVPVIARAELTPADLRASDAEVVSGGTEQVSMQLTASGLDVLTRVLVAAEVVITTTVIVTLLVMVARLAQQSISTEPFSPRLGRLLVIGGSVLAVGSVAAQISSALSGARAAELLFAMRPDALGGGWTYDTPAVFFDVVPVGVGLALVVIAGLIRNGERLQRETKGLV